MSSRSVRLLASAAVGALAVFVVVVVSAASAVGGIARSGGDGSLLTHCVKALFGPERGSAEPVVGSIDPGVIASLGVFRRTRSSADRLPAVAQLRQALAGAGATSYDPSTAVRVSGSGAHAAVYAVPATMSPPAFPAGCLDLRQFAGVNIYLELQAQETGSGPGVCLISTALTQNEPSGLPLPGAAAPKPVKTLAVARTVCQSEAVLSGYVGALGEALQGSQLALIPDGVNAITYTLENGRQFSVSVTGNLAMPPAALSMFPPLLHPTAARLGQQLTAQLPTTVTESGTSASAPVTLGRPVSLIPDAVGAFSFLRGLARSSFGAGMSSSSSGTGASCSAGTHRCVAVTVTTTCDSHEHCQTTRTIHRYRYVGPRPPAGTTGPDTQPTGPIVARVNRFVTRPTKLTLVLSGTTHPHIVVLLSVSCFSRNSEASSGGPPLRITVPSRTPVDLPGPARAFSACDVGALVVSSQRGPVHAAVARG